MALLSAPTAFAQSTTGAAASAPASTPAPAQLQEITVTARRNVESLQTVPVTVEVVSKAQMANNDATDLAKIGELAPQVIIAPFSIGTGGILTIRGISSGTTDAGVDQSVSVVVDGVPLSRGRIVTASLFDMKQVQIMEGPQALFFGKNSPAGVIDLETADPTDRFEGYVRGGYEFEASEKFGEGAISGPIAPNLTARIAFRADSMDGWIRNNAQPVADPIHPGVTLPGAVQGSNEPQGTDYAARVTLLWRPDSSFDAKLKLTYDEQQLNSMDAYSEPFCLGAQSQLTVLGIPEPGTSCRKNMTVSESAEAPKYTVNYPYGNNGVPYSDSRFFLGSLSLNKRLNDVSLASTTGYYSQYYSGAMNADYTPFNEIYDAQHEVYNLFTQELRATTTLPGPVNFMGGVYYEHSVRPWLNVPDLLHVGINPATNSYATAETAAHTTTESYSAFLQGRWHILPNLELAAGARYSHDAKDSSIENLAASPYASAVGIALIPAGQVISPRYRGNNISPEATLTWRPTSTQTLYAAYKTGYKAGGISNGSLLEVGATANNLVFGEEKVDGGEIGYKADLLERRLRLNATVYYYDYDGLQVTSFYPATISFQVQNAAAARTEGLELSSEWLATQNLSFHGNLGYNRARYVTFGDGQCFSGQTAAQGCVGGVQNLSGKPLTRAPDVTFNLGGDYRFAVTNRWNADASLNGNYSGAYQADPDYSPGGEQSSFWRLDAAIHLLSVDGHYDLALIGRNLTNSYYMLAAAGLPAATANEYLGTFGRPREVILQAQYKF